MFYIHTLSRQLLFHIKLNKGMIVDVKSVKGFLHAKIFTQWCVVLMNPLAPGRCGCDIKLLIFELI